MLRRLALIGTVLAASAAPARAQLPYAQDLVPTRTALGRLGLEKNWYAVVPLAKGAERVIGVSHSGGLVFAHTNLGNFHAFDGESGKLAWSTRLGASTPRSFPASTNSRSVFVTNFVHLHALDKANGSEQFKIRLESTPSSGTAADEERVMLGLVNGKLQAFAAYDRRNANPPGPGAGVFDFAWSTNRPIPSQPVPADRVTAFASQDGKLYVVTNSSKEVLYRYLTQGPVEAPLAALGNRTVVVASTDHNVYAVDLFTGETRWVVPTGAPITFRPLATADEVFALNAAGDLYCIDGKTGQTRWSRNTGPESRLLSVGVARIYVFSKDRELIVIDHKNGVSVSDARGAARSGVNLNEYSIFRTNPEDDRLFFATPSGFLLSLREIGLNSPRYLRDPKLPEFGTLPPEGEPTSPPTPPAGSAPPAGVDAGAAATTEVVSPPK